MGDRTRLPLPDCKGVHFDGYSAQTMREYSDSENAALRERVKVLEDAVQHYESALRDAWLEGAKGASWEFWNRARIVLAALEKT